MILLQTMSSAQLEGLWRTTLQVDECEDEEEDASPLSTFIHTNQPRPAANHSTAAVASQPSQPTPSAVREVPTNSVLSYYKRIAVNGDVVHGHTYSKTKQTNNSVVLLKDGSIFTVSHFIDMGDQCLYAIGKYGTCTVQKLARGSLN
ncbi:hypothetical protein ABVT39_017892 [Epinephelus coioides]